MSFYSGSIKILYVDISGEWIPVACLTSNTLEEELDLLPGLSSSSGGWEGARATRQRATVSFDGLQALTEGVGADTTKASYDRLKTLKRTRAKLNWKIEDTNVNWTDQFEGYIISLSESAPVDDFLSFSGQIRITGVPSFTTNDISYIFMNGETALAMDGTELLFN